MTAPGLPTIERFWMKVEKTASCWLWTAAETANGYGMFGGGPRCKAMPAHRFSYEYHVGPIPDGLVVDHLCRVRACVNPEHLEPVTTAENNRRARAFRMVRAA